MTVQGGYNRTSRPALCRLPGGAGVDKGAGVDEGDLFYTGVFYTGVFYTGTHGVEEGAGVEDERRKNLF